MLYIQTHINIYIYTYIHINIYTILTSDYTYYKNNTHAVHTIHTYHTYHTQHSHTLQKHPKHIHQTLSSDSYATSFNGNVNLDCHLDVKSKQLL